MNWKTRITSNPKVLVGKPVIKGTRISVEFIIDLLADGWTKQEIIQEYDHVTEKDIQACLAFASAAVKSQQPLIKKAS